MFSDGTISWIYKCKDGDKTIITALDQKTAIIEIRMNTLKNIRLEFFDEMLIVKWF